MKNINEIFKPQGTLYLKDITFDLKTVETSPTKSKVYTMDKIEATIDEQNRSLVTTFTREVKHEPESLFNLSVSYCAVFTFKDDIENIKEYDAHMLKQKMLTQGNSLIINIITRVSLLIAQITSSHGANPLITPPGYVESKTT